MSGGDPTPLEVLDARGTDAWARHRDEASADFCARHGCSGDWSSILDDGPPVTEVRSSAVLEAILGALHRRTVRYVVIGGLAALAHAAAHEYPPPADVRDFDIAPCLHEANMDRLRMALVDMDPDTRGVLDVAFILNGPRFRDLLARSFPARLGQYPVRVAALEDVIRSKRAADRPSDRERLPLLVEMLAATGPVRVRM